MLDRRSRVTVVGAGKRIDVALPSESPIGEYVSDLAGLCGSAGGGLMTPAWSLAPAGREAWPVGLSLSEAGVADGQVLYLRDSARDPGTAPVVEDIEELVADESQKHRGDLKKRGVLTVWLGAGWLTALAAVVALRPPGGGMPAAVGLIVVALTVLGLGWGLNERKAKLPAGAVLAVSLGAVPLLAAAGGLLGQPLGLFWCGVVLGANLGAVMALAATPQPAILAAEVPLAAGGALGVVLAATGADGTQTAAAAALAAIAIIAVARPLAGAVAAYSAKMPKVASGVAPATVGLVLRARQLMALILVPPAVALAVALPALALSGRGWALGLAAATGLGLLVRARQVGFLSEVVTLGAAGGIGLFSVCGASAYRYLGMNIAVWVLAVLGGVILAAGVAVAVTYRPAAEDDRTPFGPADTRDRGKALDTLGMLCLIATATLAMGVFGVFDALFTMGRTIVG